MNSDCNIHQHPISDEVDEAFQEVKKKQKKLKDLLHNIENLNDDEEEKIHLLEHARETERIQKEEAQSKVKDFRIVLRETETVSLLELEPVVFCRGTEEAQSVEAYTKAFHDYQNRKRHVLKIDGSTQTLSSLKLRKGIQTTSVQSEDHGVMATECDMFDSFKKLETRYLQGETSENYSHKLRQAVQMCQRVLASNNFRYEQILFTLKHEPGRSFKYNLEILWELKEEWTGEVNHITLNPVNQKIIAVAYGNVRKPTTGGTVCLWNAKNPQRPERLIQFQSPVTCLAFSDDHPRYLALVTLSGDVIVIDVERHEAQGRVLASSPTAIVDDPLWWVIWFRHRDLDRVTERVMTVGSSGVVYLWDPDMRQHTKLAELTYSRTPHDALYTQSLSKEIKTVRGMKVDHRDTQFFMTNYQGTAIELDPTDSSSYYITTNQGSILKVKTRRILGENSATPAHQGAVLGMRHSPFTSAVFLTHGADAATKIWVSGLAKPVIDLKTKTFHPITCAIWSPSHSTVLLSLSNTELSLWDISRSHLDPMFVLKPPPFDGSGDSQIMFKTAQFNTKGTILYVGLSDGTVTVYRLVNMPHPPFLQKSHLLRAFKKATCQNEELYEEIEFILR